MHVISLAKFEMAGFAITKTSSSLYRRALCQVNTVDTVVIYIYKYVYAKQTHWHVNVCLLLFPLFISFAILSFLRCCAVPNSLTRFNG